MDTSSLTVPGLLVTAVGALATVARVLDARHERTRERYETKLDAIRQEYEERLESLRAELKEEQKARDRDAELFIKALERKRIESSPPSAQVSQIQSGRKSQLP